MVSYSSFLLESTYVLVDRIVSGPFASLNHYRILGSMRMQVRAAWVVVAKVSSKLFYLTLCHSPAAYIRIHSRRHCRALLQKSIVDFSRRYWHRKEYSCLVVIIVVLEVLQHEQCASLCFLCWEHIHQSLITKGRESET